MSILKSFWSRNTKLGLATAPGRGALRRAGGATEQRHRLAGGGDRVEETVEKRGQIYFYARYAEQQSMENKSVPNGAYLTVNPLI